MDNKYLNAAVFKRNTAVQKLCSDYLQVILQLNDILNRRSSVFHIFVFKLKYNKY